MVPLAADWPTIASLATAAGTLVLAVATFASVRSARASTKIAEQALQEQRRPILTQSRLDDPVQKIMFVEGHWVQASGGHGVAEHDGYLYFAMSLRNVGSGIGVCRGWHVTAGLQSSRIAGDHFPEDQFRLQSRDLYIPAGDIGMWQGALRDRNDRTFRAVAEAIDNQDSVSIELLYTDQAGQQRTISRFGLIPYQTQTGGVDWFGVINRHWYLDGPGPRPDEEVTAAAEVVLSEREAAEAVALTELEAEAEAEAEVTPAANREEEEAPETAADTRAGDETGPQPGIAATPAAESVGAEDAQTPPPEPVSVIPRPSCE